MRWRETIQAKSGQNCVDGNSFGIEQLAQDDYSIDWKHGEPGLSTDDFESQRLSAQEISTIEGYAGLALKTVGDVAKTNVGYDAATVKRLSDDLTRIRKTLDEAARERLATIYGAFLGKAVIEANREFDGRWVRIRNGDVAVRFGKSLSGNTIIALPITRTFKHIDEGEVYSIYSYFQSIPEALGAPSPARERTADRPPQATDQRREEATHTIARLGRAADGTELDLALPQSQCCNCGSAKDLETLPSPMRYRRVLDGKGLQFTLDLPYCSNCGFTAGRYPKNLAYKAFAVWAAYMVFIFAVILPLSARPFFARLGGPMLLVFTLFVVATFYWIRRPTAPQTSVYQPIRLAGFGGDADHIRKLSLRFSNRKYAGSFSKLNRKLLGKGLLSVL